MKRISFFLFSTLALVGVSAKAQVKIGNNPTVVQESAALELESPNKALVLSRVASTAAISNPMNGMVVYDLSTRTVRVFQAGYWATLNYSTPSVFSVNCDASGFSAGTFTAGSALPGGTTFSVTINNTSGSNRVIVPTASNVLLTGASAGITVGTPSPSVATNIPNGGSLVITYPLSGTPTAPGTLVVNYSANDNNTPSIAATCMANKQIN